MSKITAVFVQKVKPTDRRQEIPDSLVKGLYLIVQPSGVKGWQVRYRTGSAQRRMTLGRYPVLSLADARERAREALLAAQAGEDPAEAARLAKKARGGVAERDTVRELVELHAKRHLSTLKSGKTVKRELDRHVVSRWGDRDVHSITRRDVIDLLDEIVDSGREITANRVRGYLGKFFNFLIERDVIQTSPMLGVKRPAKERSRDRFLSDDELRWFLEATDRVGLPWGPVGKVLLLTGQRLGEVVGMREAELQGDVWSLPGERTKNGRPHVVPLSEQMREVLGAAPRMNSKAGLIFTTTGETPLSGFSKGRAVLAEAMEEIAAEERGEPVDIPRWTFHDLRRTAATIMARLGQPVHVVEAVLNHVSGAVSGVAAVYNRYQYEDEKRAALFAWARYLDDLAYKPEGNVVNMKGTNA
ncbi:MULTISPECIES: tyrosine-type recombinase/integrase [unclassified Sulfitobacter]|uniref:tyrosine-type recombinase/integrase n=1 Tax=unclassified Sulfitobacter TaxID=196795 RepID=UPI0037471580